ncbi:MAG: DUF4296 domain-containing protein [Bacteroidota bacterium]
MLFFVKKPFLILSLFLTLSFSCSNEEVPEGVLDKDKMMEVLMEIHILEAKIQKLYVPADSSELLYHHYEKMLFDDLGVTEEEYDKSLIYYVDHSDELGRMYFQIVDSLMLRQTIAP